MEDLTLEQTKDYCPPEPPGTQEEPCEGTITGTIKMDCCCCCPQLKSRTIAVDIPPGTPDQVQAQAVAAVNALEAQGWILLGSSTIVPGPTSGGLKVWLHLGYYA